MELCCGEVVFTGRGHGDMGHAGQWVAVEDVRSEVEQRRRKVLDRPWSWVRQVHGAAVVLVERPGGGAGETGDALVTTAPGTALAILTADCAPVAMGGDNGAMAAVHAGWRGLAAGVIEAAADALRATGSERIVAALGPCIHAECYEFSPTDLDELAARLGPMVRGETSAGGPALDVPAAVRATLAKAGVELVHDEDVCTACSTDYYSHRARQEKERQAMVVLEALTTRLAEVRRRIEGAGGDLGRVTIIAVTKGFGADAVTAAKEAGLVDVGENYAQELVAKATETEGVRWHFVGRLQRNKVRELAPIVHLWQSVDRASLGDEVAKRAPGARVLVQVNASGEPQKGGCSWEEAPGLVDRFRDAGLAVEGLMAVGPAGPPEAARPGFRRLAGMAGELDLAELSMGMTADLEVAVQEGATMVRVGTALFGPGPGPGDPAG